LDWPLIRKPTLSAIDGRNTKFGGHHCQCPAVVQLWKKHRKPPLHSI
jgi:hypothetical protein